MELSMKYVVLDNLNFDCRDYAPGDIVQLDDEATAEQLIALGVIEEGDGDGSADDGGAAGPELADMSIAQLKAFAAEQGIDLGTATKKAEIALAIKEALAAKTAEADAAAASAAAVLNAGETAGTNPGDTADTAGQ